MSTRYVRCNVESGGYTTQGSDEWVDYEPYSGAEPFGTNIPQSIKATFTNVYPNYTSNVTVSFSIKLQLSNGNWYTIYSSSAVGNKNSSSIFNTPIIQLNSDLVGLLQNNSISHIGIFQDGSRHIRGTSSSSATIEIDYIEYTPPPIVVTAPSNISYSQTGQTIYFSWSASSVSGGSGNIEYTLRDSEGVEIASTTATSLSIPASKIGYGSFQYQITADYSGQTASSGFFWLTSHAPSVTLPANPTITVSGRNLVVSFSGGSTGSYGSGSITYHLFYGNQNTGYFETEVAVTPPSSITVPYSYNVQYGFTIIAYYSGAEAQSSTVYKTVSAPSITKQPAVTKVSPASGKQTTITWSAAQVANQGIAVIDYHYYIGIKKTYSGNASYIGGTRNLSATISESKILEKCGSSFRGTCYLFVCAEWYDGKERGGWTTPSASALTFVYDPVTLTAPSNIKASQSGTNVTFSWTAAVASGGNGGITYKLFNLSDGVVVTSTTATSVTIAASTLGYANMQWRIIAEYDGHTQNSASIYFEPKAPSLSTPAKPTVTISGNKFTVTWSAASGAYGTGNVTYVLHYGNKSTGYFESSFDVGTARTYTIEFTDWSMQHGFTVTARYSGLKTDSETTYITTPTPTLTKPGAPQVSQTGRKVTVTWAAAKGSNGVGDVYYYLFAGSEDSVVYQGAGTSAVITPPAYDESKGYFVLATYCGAEQWSTTTYFTANSPQLTPSGTPSVSYSDGVFTLSWEAAVGSYGDGEVTYTVFYGDAANGFSSKSKSVGTATTTAIAMWIEDAECRFWIRASYSGKTADSSYASIVVGSHRTVNYCVPDTGQFVQCIAYYCADGITFTEQIPHYCSDGQNFVECSN